MQELEHIEVGQQENDKTGDPLRNGMVKINANFTKVQTGVHAVELSVLNAAQTADQAKAKADGDIPAAEKGMAGGVAPLDGNGKVPAAHLEDYVPVDEKGAAGGIAPLDSGAKVPMSNLPVGIPGGLAPLGADGKVPPANLPAAENAIPLSQKGQPNGVPTLDSGGKVPTGQLPPIPTGPPAASVGWWPLRSSIPAGQVPADGQTISRATYPDLAAMVVEGKVPVVPEADWLADPLKRGSYTVGDGSTTVRLPDLNGKAAGSLGAVFIRGDGARTSGVTGSIANDTNRSHTHSLGVYGPTAGNSASFASGGGVAISTYFTAANGGDEAKPLSAHGVWTIQAFGAVTNPGSADAAQLASDYATLNSAHQTLKGQFQDLKSKALGVDQTWNSFTAGAGAGQRMTTVTYTNSTSRPIIVAIQFSTTGNNGYLIGFVDGKSVAFGSWGPSGSGLGINFIVPSGSSYRVDSALAANIEWREYR